jgi:hypothetical protein
MNPWHLRNCPPRTDWTDAQLAAHRAEMETELELLAEMNDPSTRIPAITASLSKTEVEMMRRLFA